MSKSKEHQSKNDRSQKLTEKNIEFFWESDFWALEQSETIEFYHEQLSYLISNAHQMSKKDLEYFSKLVRKPWKRKRASSYSERSAKIFWKYHAWFIINDEKPPKRADAVRAIMKEYKLEKPTAEKVYDLSMKFNGDPPPMKDRKSNINSSS